MVVPTVDRGFLLVVFCSMEITGLKPVILSTSGRSCDAAYRPAVFEVGLELVLESLAVVEFYRQGGSGHVPSIFSVSNVNNYRCYFKIATGPLPGGVTRARFLP